MNHCILKYIQCYHSTCNVCGTIYPDIPVYSCTQRIFSSCTRPAGPAEIRESAPATVLTLGTQVQAQSSCLLSFGFRSPPVLGGRSGRGGRRPQRRPQRPGRPAAVATATATATAAVALRARGVFRPFPP